MEIKDKDWLQETWRIKEKLSKEAREMGLKMYLEQAGEKAEEILIKKLKKKDFALKT